MGISREFYDACCQYEFDNRWLHTLIKSNHSEKANSLIRKTQLRANRKNIVDRFLVKRYLNKLITLYGIFIHPDTNIGLGLKLPHPNGIVIGESVEIGENTTIYQQVTIGSAHVGDWKNNKQPKIGNNVTLFAGCKIIGDIKIADNVTIAAGAVVVKSIREPFTVWGGVPASKLSDKK
jgi:serine O-acetyltransferase